MAGGEGAHPVSDACDYARFCSGLDFWAITDHADASNLEEIAAQLVRFSREGLAGFAVTFIPGVELTHVPPEQIAPLARRAPARQRLPAQRLLGLRGRHDPDAAAPARSGDLQRERPGNEEEPQAKEDERRERTIHGT